MSVKDQIARELAKRDRQAAKKDQLSPAGWFNDPELPTRQRFWDGSKWTSQVRTDGVETVDPPVRFKGIRWQYSVINIGSFSAMSRMEDVLGSAGGLGWELVGVYDKASN